MSSAVSFPRVSNLPIGDLRFCILATAEILIPRLPIAQTFPAYEPIALFHHLDGPSASIFEVSRRAAMA